MKKDTTKVLEHLRDVGSLTSLEALQRGYGSRLAARVHELRQAGHEIEVDKITVERGDGTEVQVARYSLVKLAEAAPAPAPKVQAGPSPGAVPPPGFEFERAAVVFVFLALFLGVALGVLREQLS